MIRSTLVAARAVCSACLDIGLSVCANKRNRELDYHLTDSLTHRLVNGQAQERALFRLPVDRLRRQAETIEASEQPNQIRGIVDDFEAEVNCGARVVVVDHHTGRIRQGFDLLLGPAAAAAAARALFLELGDLALELLDVADCGFENG